MCTGSRPSTSSTRTSRIWRASAPRVCSSSNTVGSVRTGIAARAALAHDPRARRAGRGGDRDDHFVGLGVVEDARQVAFGVAAHAHAVDAQAPLERVVVEEADRQRGPSSRLRMISRATMPPALAGADDQHRALALARRAERRQRAALVDAARERAHADEEDERRAARTARSRRSAAPTATRAAVRRVAVAPGAAPRSRRPSAARSRTTARTTAS